MKLSRIRYHAIKHKKTPDGAPSFHTGIWYHLNEQRTGANAVRLFTAIALSMI
jgi:hypothetical protein